jgi:peptidyl-prolyl cis-trans isomerase D
MLEQMRKSSQSLLIYILFGIVIAVFIINFGPQSRGGGGCEGALGGDESAARIDGEALSEQAFRSSFLLLGGGNQPSQMLKLRRFKETVMDKLIERELLAQEAERLGFSISEDDVHKMLLDGRIIGLGIPHSIPRIQRDGVFNYDQFKTFTQFELGLTPDRFVEQQQREMLANTMRDLLRASVKVSPEEVKAAFDIKNRQINLEYVRFPSRKYEGEVELSADEIAAYVKANEAKLKETFGQRKSLYTDMPPEVRVREILVKVPAAPDASSGGDSAGASTAAGDAAKKRAEALRARIAKGEPFAKVARAASDDEDSRTRGGDLGWRRKGTLGLDDPGEAQLFAAKPGEVAGPLKTAQGFALLTTSGTRKGTLGFDDVKAELAEENLRMEKAIALAKAKAQAALDAARAAPDQSFKVLFPGADDTATTKTDKADAGDKTAQASDAAAKAAPKSAKGKGDAKAAVAIDARAEETGLFSRRGTVIEQIGDSPELAKAAWSLKPEAPLGGPFEIAGSYVVVRLKERKDPDPAELEKKQADLRRDAELTKWNDVFTSWVKSRCIEVRTAGRITVNRSLLRYEDSQEPPPYQPCGDEGPRRPS